MRLVIEEQGAPAPEKEPAPGFDLQDALLLVGILLLEIAALVIWWPAALILGGSFALGFAWLIERSKSLTIRKTHGNPDQ